MPTAARAHEAAWDGEQGAPQRLGGGALQAVWGEGGDAAQQVVGQGGQGEPGGVRGEPAGGQVR